MLSGAPGEFGRRLVAITDSHSHSHSHVDTDLDACFSLAMLKAIGEMRTQWLREGIADVR